MENFFSLLGSLTGSRCNIDFPKYEVSSLGYVRNIETQRILKTSKNRKYPEVSLRIEKTSKILGLNRLVCIIHNGPSTEEGKILVQCINRNTHDARAENLKWASNSEIVLNSHPTGKIGFRRKVQKLDENGEMEEYETLKKAAESVNSYGCNVRKSIKSKEKFKGFYWKYTDEKTTYINKEGEIWKICSERENYMVSNFGNIKHKNSNCLLKLSRRGNNFPLYLCVCLQKKSYIAHQLVASAFCHKPDNATCVDHIDRNPENNHAHNLRWVTHSENSNNPNTITVKEKRIVQKNDDGKVIEAFRSMKAASKKTGINHGNICQCCKEQLKHAGGFKWEYEK